MKNKIKLLLVGGGSGGHIYPLLAVSEYLIDEKIIEQKNLHFVIAKNNADYKYFENTQYSYSTVSVAKLRRYFSWENFLDLFIFIKNIFSSFFFLLKNRPEKIFSKGGFVSLPFGISSFLLRIPFYLHETDSSMGLSNKLLSKIATKIFTGFPSENNNNYNNIFVGNPVRKKFFRSLSEVEGKRKKSKKIKSLKILIFGGSQGAQRINEWARNFFSSVKNVEILLVAGKNKTKPPKSPLSGGLEFYITEVEFLSDTFIEEVHKADIVITRAGGSVAELAAAKKMCSSHSFTFSSE